ncbi:MAG: 50S ribosomal protein L29 [Patescibacteria group bacterium]
MEFKDLKNKEISDLHKLLAENREQERQLRFKDAVNQLKDVRKIRKTKKTVARILTLLNQKDKQDNNK